MILLLNKEITIGQAELLASEHQFHFLKSEEGLYLITPSSVKNIPSSLEKYCSESWVMEDDMQLSSRNFFKETREIRVGTITIGGSGNSTVMMAGPCSAESEEQVKESASFIASCQLKILRAGAYKPRTSPYTFQGMGRKGLELLRKYGDEFGLKIISEVRDATHLADVAELADIVQIGAKAMYDQGILRYCATLKKPVLLKRGFGSTVQEWIQAAEFILCGGNDQVMLCERGIRTFENKTRFTLDLCSVAWVKKHCNLPVILDPSHAMGYAFGVPDLARACIAMGVDGLLIETHPDPSLALSDAAQQLNHQEFRELIASLHPVAKAVGKMIV